jgi:lipooligosaccharide transport system ATP-binding protein
MKQRPCSIHVLVVREDGLALGVEEVVIPDAQQGEDDGEVLLEGGGAEVLVHLEGAGEEVLEVDYDEKLVPLLKEAFPEARIERLGDRMQIFTDQPHGVFEAFLKEHKLQNVSLRNANLEDVFLKLTGRGLREE